MELYKALQTIINRHGKETIRTEVLVNYLADYNAYEIKPTKVVTKTLLKLGYGEKIYILDESKAPDKLLKVKNYLSEMVLSQGFQEKHVSYVIDSFCYALGWLQVPPDVITQERLAESVNKRNIIVGNVPFSMIFVQGGSFDMGATPEQGWFAAFDEKPSQQVTVSDFFIGETAATQNLWQEVMHDNPSHFKGGNLPVERVSWNECYTFIEKLNQITECKFRLPTEAEWEYAARGGKSSQHHKYAGCDDGQQTSFVWAKDNSNTQSHEVKSLQPNELGIYDMSGNIGEWCEDWYFNSYANSGSRVNPKGPSFGTNRVYRGGSWNDKLMNCRVSKRFSMNPIYRNKLVGLRLAVSNI